MNIIKAFPEKLDKITYLLTEVYCFTMLGEIKNIFSELHATKDVMIADGQ
jgi:hypothetical protein